MITITRDRDASTTHDLVLALLLYLPTLFFVPAAGYVLAIAFFFLYSKAQPLQRRDWLLALFVLLAMLNVEFGMPNYDAAKHGFALSILFIFPCMWIGRSLNRRVLKYFLTFTLMECMTVLYEVATHKMFIFAAQGAAGESLADPTEGGDLLYYFRPYGLSSNSSTMALKIFVGILLVFFLFDRIKFPKLTLSTLYLLCLITFNRTAMVASLVIGSGIYIGYIISIRKSGRKLLPHFIGWAILSGLVVHFFGEAVFQFTRGGNSTSGVLTGRTQIWATAIDFIRENPFWGNHSLSFRLQYYGKWMHCHNSFLQIFATHGMIALLLLAFVISGIRLRGLIFIAPILVFSLSQYGVFWNFSYLDVIFYFFLDWDGAFLSRRLVDLRWSLGTEHTPGVLGAQG